MSNLKKKIEKSISKGASSTTDAWRLKMLSNEYKIYKNNHKELQRLVEIYLDKE